MKDLWSWVFLIALTVVILIAAQTEQVFDCQYDDQLMSSSGMCIEPDSLLDAATDANLSDIVEGGE